MPVKKTSKIPSLDTSSEVTQETTLYLEALDQYLSEVQQYPLLSDEEQRRLTIDMVSFKKKVAGGDVTYREPLRLARKKLIERNLRLALRRTLHFYGQKGRPLFLDLLQEANVGLIEGIDHYDPDQAEQLSTYVVYWIDRHILYYLGRNKYSLYLPINVVAEITKVRNLYQALRQEGKPSTFKDIGKQLEMTEAHVGELLSHNFQALYFSQPVLTTSQTDEPMLIEELAAGVDPEDDFSERVIGMLTQQDFLTSISGSLDEEEQDFLRLRFGLAGERAHTFQEIATIYQIKESKVKGKLVKIFRKLRNPKNAHLYNMLYNGKDLE